MQFMLEYPVAHANYSAHYLDPAVLIAVASGAERAGFTSIGFTDHPAPIRQMDAGGRP